MDNKKCCAWAQGVEEVYRDYHDEEWGVPIHNDVQHFEILTLEGAQAGLNWLTVLRRRFGYRKVFARFDVEKVAAFSPEKCLEIRKDIRIIRNQLKIDSTVNNAKCFLEVQAEFGSFDKYIWGFVGGKPLVNQWENHSELPAQTELSGRIADD